MSFFLTVKKRQEEKEWQKKCRHIPMCASCLSIHNKDFFYEAIDTKKINEKKQDNFF